MGALDSSNLELLTKELSLKWEADTRLLARRERAWRFERRYIELLRDSVDKGIPVIEELDKIVTKVRKDCE